MRKIFEHRILYGQMDDGGESCQKMSDADGQRCKQYHCLDVKCTTKINTSKIFYRHFLSHFVQH